MFLTRGCPRCHGPLTATDDVYTDTGENLTDLCCLGCGHALTWAQRLALTDRRRCRGRARPAMVIVVLPPAGVASSHVAA